MYSRVVIISRVTFFYNYNIPVFSLWQAQWVAPALSPHLLFCPMKANVSRLPKQQSHRRRSPVHHILSSELQTCSLQTAEGYQVWGGISEPPAAWWAQMKDGKFQSWLCEHIPAAVKARIHSLDNGSMDIREELEWDWGMRVSLCARTIHILKYNRNGLKTRQWVYWN